MKTCDAESKRLRIRLLKVLSGNVGHSCRFECRGDVAILRGVNREFRFPVASLEQCLADDLVAIADERLVLKSAGFSHLKRALHPEEPFQAQNRLVVEKTVKIDAEPVRVTLNEAESPLLRLYSRKEKNGKTWLSEADFRAGERLRADFEKSSLQPRISANWEASVASGTRGNGTADLSDFAVDARKRVESAINALGPELAEVALDICCFLKGLETVERERGWPPRSAKLMLRTALGALARHYGMVSNTSERRRRRIQLWASADYRPSIQHG